MEKKLYRKNSRLEVRIFVPKDFKAWKEANINMEGAQNKWDLGRRALKN